MEIIFNYPSWFILLCALAGVVYASALYVRNRTTRHLHPALLVILGLFRFGVVAMTAFFLLKPLVKTVEREVEKPLVIIAQDNSESVIAGPDSLLIKTQVVQDLQNLSEELGEEYDVRTFSFGEKVSEGLDSLDFSEKLTDMSALLDELYSRFSNRNLGAVLIGSDGLYNKGLNPVYASSQLDAPVYTLALGDTTIKRDVLIKEVAHNRLAYLGNKFPIEVRVDARQAGGETVQVNISRNGESLFSQVISFNGDYDSQVVSTALEASSTGLQRYTITVSGIDDEFTKANNRKDIFIDVLDSRQRILILAASPHPDINALRFAIESNQNYEVTTALVTDFFGNMADYNLVVFHQLPGNGMRGVELSTEALSKDIPSLFIMGGQSAIPQFNKLNLGFSLNNSKGLINDVSGTYNKDFSLFKSDEDWQNVLRKLPPMQVPFGDLVESPGVASAVFQRIGSIETQKTLIGFNRVNGTKVGVIAGEGLWRWRMVSHLESGSHKLFDGFTTKMVQYLASKEDKSYFRVTGKTDLQENEPIVFEAELYNQAYELVNDPDVEFVVKSEDDQQYTYNFGRNGASYMLNAGNLPVGNYSYEAKTNLSGQVYTSRGEFSISPVQLELSTSQADHGMLYNLAQNHGGQMIYPSEISSFKKILESNGALSSVSHETRVLTDLINFRWFLWLIIGLLCLEWLLRKRNGTY